MILKKSTTKSQRVCGKIFKNQIAENFGVSKSLVYKILSEYDDGGFASIKRLIPGEVHSRNIERAKAYLSELVTRTNENLTVSQMHQRLTSNKHFQITRSETYGLLK